MMKSSGTNTSRALDRAVLERNVQREVAAANGDARRAARDERAGDAAIRILAQQLVGIEEPEREADHRGDRRERDVALREVEPDADDLLALPLALADHAGVGEGRRIGARTRTREREARNFFAARKTREVIVLLLFSAVVVQQFRRAERVRHGDSRRGGDAAAADLRQHARVRVGRKSSSPPYFFGMIIAKKPFDFEVIPHLRRHVAALVVMSQSSSILHSSSHGPSMKACSSSDRRGGFRGKQLAPARRTREQLAIPPHRAGFERFALRLRHGRQQLLYVRLSGSAG